MSRGYFITIEGPDGAAKSTLAEVLHKTLKERGVSSLLTREPGGTDFGESIRQLFLNQDDLPVESEILLMQAQRWKHTRDVIQPALERNEVVVCDRYIESTYVYQGGGDSRLENMIRRTAPPVTPDLVVFLDVEYEDMVGRLKQGRTTNRLDTLDRTTFEDRRRLFQTRWLYREERGLESVYLLTSDYGERSEMLAGLLEALDLESIQQHIG